MKLNPAQNAEYTFLKNQVDKAMENYMKTNPDPNAKNQYYYAKKDLSDFVSARRKEGYSI